ncbi:hypothetical protein BJX65DRAFT_26567 [Aspergillus insuetus]
MAIAHRDTDSYAVIKILIQHGMRLDIHYRILLALLVPERFDEFRLLCDAGLDIPGRPRLLRYLYHRATAVPRPHRHQPLVDLLVEMGVQYSFEHIQVRGGLAGLRAGDRRLELELTLYTECCFERLENNRPLPT